MKHAVRYVEEGLASLTLAGPAPSGSDSGPLSSLELELHAVMSALTAVQSSWGLVEGQLDAIGKDFFSALFRR